MKALNFNSYLFCRNYKFYVDPTSTSPIELGTIEYPFKYIVAPFREMLNFYHDDSTYNATILLKESTSSTVVELIEPLVFFLANQVLVTSYSLTSSTPARG